MEFNDLKAQYARLKNEIDGAILKVLQRGDYILGEEVRRLESELAEYVGSKYCVTCANGTDALSLALQTMNIGKGDAVFLPAFTFFATAETVTRAGAIPVFVDVDKDTFNLDAKKLSAAIEKVRGDGKYKPKAVVPVDLFGLPCDYDAISLIAQKYNMLVIEDGAQGFGGEYNGRKACSFGHISTTSFFPAKPLGCYGDGGALFVDDENYYKQLLSIRFHGKGADKYDNVKLGYNSRLDTIQAAILLVKLKAFKEFELKRRIEIGVCYNELLKDVVRTPYIPENYKSSYAQYTITLKDSKEREKLMAHLKSEGIPSMVYYPRCMHEQTVYKNYPCIYFDLKNAKSLTESVLSLPMHPYLENTEIIHVAESVKRGLGK